MSKINLTEEEKIKIGKQCCNCGTKEDLEYHHIVPLSMGRILGFSTCRMEKNKICNG